MSEFRLHDIETAPEESRDKLRGAEQAMGFLPNLFAKMAEAPQVLEAYQTLSGLFQKTSLSAVEQQVVLLTASVENECHFCVAAHSGGAKKAGIDDADLQALREQRPLQDKRLDALHAFALDVVRKRGWVGDDAVDRFLEAGFTRQQVLEVVLGVTMKTLSNYTNHIAGTPLNEELKPLAWDGKAA